MASEGNRAKRVNVRLAPEMHERLSEWAERMGVAPSTLAAIAIGEYVNNKETLQTNAQRSSVLVGKQVGGAMAEILSDPERLHAMATALNLSDDQMSLALKKEVSD